MALYPALFHLSFAGAYRHRNLTSFSGNKHIFIIPYYLSTSRKQPGIYTFLTVTKTFQEDIYAIRH